jgi:hypothetical protein
VPVGLSGRDHEDLGLPGARAFADESGGRDDERAPATFSTPTRARPNIPPTSWLCPGTSTTTSNDRVRSSTSGVTRTTLPWTASPPSARP